VWRFVSGLRGSAHGCGASCLACAAAPTGVALRVLPYDLGPPNHACQGVRKSKECGWERYGPLDACGCLRQVIREDTNTRPLGGLPSGEDSLFTRVVSPAESAVCAHEWVRMEDKRKSSPDRQITGRGKGVGASHMTCLR
jgi:hypothetical protein